MAAALKRPLSSLSETVSFHTEQSRDCPVPAVGVDFCLASALHGTSLQGHALKWNPGSSSHKVSHFHLRFVQTNPCDRRPCEARKIFGF